MAPEANSEVITLDRRAELWDSCFVPAPLVLIGTRETNGESNFAPKHMATPLGLGRCFGFVCTPRHSTYGNVERTGEFTVTFPRPSQILLTSLAAARRDEDDSKPELRALPTFPAEEVDSTFLRDGYFFLECRLQRFVAGFGEHCLVAGTVVRAHVHREAQRGMDRDDQELIDRAPLLTYLHPGRFATVSQSFSFPFPRGFER